MAKCFLASKNNYQVSVKYGKEEIQIPPRASKVLIQDDSLLGEIPRGIIKISAS